MTTRGAVTGWVALAFALVVAGPLCTPAAAQHEAEHKPEAKAEHKPEAKAAPKAEAKPAPHQETRPEAKAPATKPVAGAKPTEPAGHGAATGHGASAGEKPAAEKPSGAAGRGASQQDVQAVIQRIKEHVAADTGGAPPAAREPAPHGNAAAPAAHDSAPRGAPLAPAARPVAASAPHAPAPAGHVAGPAAGRVTLIWRLSLNWSDLPPPSERVHLVWPR